MVCSMFKWGRFGPFFLFILIFSIITYLLFPLFSVFMTKSPSLLFEKLNSNITYDALLLSLQTTSISLVIIILFGTPLAYWLAKSDFIGKPWLEVALKMPIVAPTAVVGVGLLLVFGQRGIL